MLPIRNFKPLARKGQNRHAHPVFTNCWSIIDDQLVKVSGPWLVPTGGNDGLDKADKCQ